MRRAALIAILSLVAASPPASASPTHTLEGTCTVSGQLTFQPPLGNELRPTALRDAASGTCTGTLDGVAVQDAPVSVRANGGGDLSCLAGHTTTTGTITFANGARIRFWTDTSGALTQFVSRWGGAVSGTGVAYVSFLAHADQAALAACQAGTFRAARYDMVARTITPVAG